MLQAACSSGLIESIMTVGAAQELAAQAVVPSLLEDVCMQAAPWPKDTARGRMLRTLLKRPGLCLPGHAQAVILQQLCHQLPANILFC